MSEVAPWEGRRDRLRLVAGVDLGGSGALALIDVTRESVFFVTPIPIVMKRVGKTDRKRIDYEGLWAVLEMMHGLDVELFAAEKPGAGFGAGGRELGEHVGAFSMAAEILKARVEWVTPAKWKTSLKVPADKREACLRAEALFPNDKAKLKGTKGGRADGKAEAAMIGLYAARNLL